MSSSTGPADTAGDAATGMCHTSSVRRTSCPRPPAPATGRGALRLGAARLTMAHGNHRAYPMGVGSPGDGIPVLHAAGTARQLSVIGRPRRTDMQDG